jgi:hypothetical protein
MRVSRTFRRALAQHGDGVGRQRDRSLAVLGLRILLAASAADEPLIDVSQDEDGFAAENARWSVDNTYQHYFSGG